MRTPKQGKLGKIIEIQERKILRPTEDWTAMLAPAAAFRLQTDVQLDESNVVLSVLSPERLAGHTALIRRLVLARLRNQPAVVALTASDDDIAALLFPKSAKGAKLAPKAE